MPSYNFLLEFCWNIDFKLTELKSNVVIRTIKINLLPWKPVFVVRSVGNNIFEYATLKHFVKDAMNVSGQWFRYYHYSLGWKLT